MESIKIQNTHVGKGYKPFIIAEMSGNHNQSLEKAIQIVDAAADAGAHAIKLQTYTADTMTAKGAYVINDKDSLWNGQDLYELYKVAYTPWDWHAKIFAHAHKRNIIAFSSPFDETAVDFLEKLNVPCYKVASFENTDWPLLRKVAATGKPVIMSTGVSKLSDTDESVRVLREAGCKELVLLKCTSTYPASPENSNISTIPHMAQMFKCPIGLSDHTMGIGVSVGAVALGAKLIEKHFCLDRSEGGVDSAFSMEPHEFKALVEETKRCFLSMGEIKYGIEGAEKKSLMFKRSLYFSKNMKAGDVITKEGIKIIRPGLGLEPKFLDMVIGRKIRENISANTPVTLDIL